jgi:hypothetical protein
LDAGIIALVLAGAAMLVAGLALVCGADSDLVLEHAEKPTVANAARLIASVFL